MQSAFAASILVAATAAAKILLVRTPLTISDISTMQKSYAQKITASDFGDHIPIQYLTNSTYMIKMKFGSNDQEFMVTPDTGSSNLWVYSSKCQSRSCHLHRNYDSSGPDTYFADGRDFSMGTTFGTVDGVVSKDKCKLTDDVTATMSFGEITSVETKFLSPNLSRMDGILGLGFDAASVDNLPTFMTSTTDIEEKTFAFYLKDAHEESYMTIPGIDEDLGLKEMATHKVIQPTLWNLWLSQMSGPNGTINVEFYHATIDTGLPMILGPNKIMEPLLEGVTVKKDCSDLESLPNFTFTID